MTPPNVTLSTKSKNSDSRDFKEYVKPPSYFLPFLEMYYIVSVKASVP